MTHRRRTRLCTSLVLIGLINIMAYTVAYAYVGGDAWNGGAERGAYYVRGHFLRSVEGSRTPVSRGIWIYSYLHSISIWPSLAAIALSMLVLARPHILATYREGLLGGGTLIGVIATLVILITLSATVLFCISFSSDLSLAAG